VHPALRLNDTTDLSNAQPKCGIFKRLLHLPRPEPAQIAIVVVRGAIRVLVRERAKLVCAPPDLRLVSPQDRDRFLFGARDIRLSNRREGKKRRGPPGCIVNDKLIERKREKENCPCGLCGERWT